MKKKLFHYIKNKIPDNNSFIDVVSDVLGLSYDASYRRINGKTTLSFEEGFKLIKHFNIPLNDIYNAEDSNKINISKKVNREDTPGLHEYFNEVSSIMNQFRRLKNSKYTYASKDFPIYHSLETNLLRKFKIYIYSHFLSKNKTGVQKTKFEKFVTPKVLDDIAQKVTDVFKRIKSDEIWNENIINTTLFQIKHLLELNLISPKSALSICDDLTKNIQIIEKRAINGHIEETKVDFNLYYNKMINLNNSILITSDSDNKFIIPYTPLSFFSIDDKNTTREIESYYEKQLLYSKKISGNAGMERELFFSILYGKINLMKKQIRIKESTEELLL
ncbi:hypothetical protein ACE1MK_12115 [Tenacibaculum maritimum]|uniref:hypothetical protein n=1 Tax=Tenacibaculum maritimum TaxID=107401 RepID=UPI0012E694B2|nr:hypothetical protein [Tenacibaculum maritimum]MCD9581543.1 hypothetical protein [Tenacibaculum maritimum]MCD9636081.1 hypothetical protein [Tenacibaculum maritimum]CAA0152820.1 conserved hypothetical protein [Tenacibaculum maritimum]CAA0177414.1 conserved hypothetical protein [Tenacibaculum maritimum]